MGGDDHFVFVLALYRNTHGIATKKDRLVSWVMILVAVSSSTAAISSDIYSVFSSDNGVGG